MAAMKFGRYAIYGVNSGDSRIYRMRDGRLTQLTKDHVFYYPGHLRPMLIGFLGTEQEDEPVRAVGLLSGRQISALHRRCQRYDMG